MSNDAPSPPTELRSRIMRSVRRSGTVPEIAVRRTLHAIGARYRVNVGSLPGSPDIANRARRKAIFVHGCYWHRHPRCPRASTPNKNRDFWLEKFRANVERDRRKEKELTKAGFDVLTVWECEAGAPDLGERLHDFWFGGGRE